MKRQYTEKEVGALLRRATELQGDASASVERNLSWEEVEELASDLGVDRQHLRASAMEMESPPGGGGFSLFGGPFRIDSQQVVEGEVSDELWEQVVLELRDWSGSVGRVSATGNTREWTRRIDDLEHLHVTLRPDDGKTAIWIRKSYRTGAFFAYFMLIFLGGAMTATVLKDSGLAPSAVLGLATAGVLTACAALRTGLVSWGKRHRRGVGRLVARVEKLIATSSRAVSSRAVSSRAVSSRAVVLPEAGADVREPEHLDVAPEPPRSEGVTGRPNRRRTRS